MARSEITRRGLRNVEIVQADALNTGLPKAAFDLVHERLVMIIVPKREALWQEMMSLLRPGGTIVFQDVDDISYTCVPRIRPGLPCSMRFTLYSMRIAGMPISAENFPGIYAPQVSGISRSRFM